LPIIGWLIDVLPGEMGMVEDVEFGSMLFTNGEPPVGTLVLGGVIGRAMFCARACA